MTVEKNDHAIKTTHFLVVAMVIGLIGAAIGGYKLMNLVEDGDPKIACHLLDERFKEVGHSTQWYTLTADFLKSGHCNSPFYKQYGDMIRDQQICKTNYVKERLAGNNPKACSDMKLF